MQRAPNIDASPTRVWEVTVDVEALPNHTPTMTDVTQQAPSEP